MQPGTDIFQTFIIENNDTFAPSTIFFRIHLRAYRGFPIAEGKMLTPDSKKFSQLVCPLPLSLPPEGYGGIGIICVDIELCSCRCH